MESLGRDFANIPVWAWAIPLFVATIALAGAIVTVLFQWVNANKQIKSAHNVKIAEMRQKWISDLREAMCEFQSYGVTPNLDHKRKREFYRHGTKVELMMNPKDVNYKKLQDIMYNFLDANSVEEKFRANPAYVEICQKILKAEWETLKKEVKSL